MSDPIAYLDEQRRRQREWSEKPPEGYEDETALNITGFEQYVELNEEVSTWA